MKCLACEEVTTEFRYCPEHHVYRDGMRRLTSVTQVIREVLPPDYEGVPVAKVENARERGVELDALVSAWVVGKLKEIPENTRTEVVELFEKFMPWWNRLGFRDVQSQVQIHDDEIAGTMDICADGMPMDLKCTYDVLPTHGIQVAGYCDILKTLNIGAIIHVTKRFKEPMLRSACGQARDDWATIRAFWSLKRRLAG